MYRLRHFFRLSFVSLCFLGVSTLICGFFYPAFVTLCATHQNIWIEKEGVNLGSFLVGQDFKDPKYFWGRLLQSPPHLSQHNPKLLARIEERKRELLLGEKNQDKIVPLDLLTVSASGVDPHISPESAFFQVDRISEMRHMSRETLNALIESCIEGKVLGIFGTKRVNVLRLNLALDQGV